MADTKILHERYPSTTALKTTTPIMDMVERGDTEKIEIVRRRIVYEYRPLYILAFVICFGLLAWTSAYTIVQLSDNQTARACFGVGGNWTVSDQGISECTVK